MTHFVPAGNRTASPENLSFAGKLGVLVTGVTVPKSDGGRMTNAHHAVTFMTADGIKLAAWDVPAATNRAVAILFHGYATSKAVMKSEAAILRELGLRTVLVDFRGAGDSEGWVTTVGWKEALDVTAATDWAQRKYPGLPVILLGQSMGAVAVLRANPRVEGMILECPYDKFLTTVGHRYRQMGLPAFPFAHLLLFWGGVQHGFDPFRLNPVREAERVTCPALVLAGEHDPWVLPAEARSVASAMKGPTQFVLFTNGGHGSFASEEYRLTLGAWLDATLSRRSGTGK
ncbi:MAG: hypothetical protein PCFJNLEI_02492 [Verrucomicrobiae bacterium]|nr:hypothetical protein [Verrucomicrobiae bacterium]